MEIKDLSKGSGEQGEGAPITYEPIIEQEPRIEAEIRAIIMIRIDDAGSLKRAFDDFLISWD